MADDAGRSRQGLQLIGSLVAAAVLVAGTAGLAAANVTGTIACADEAADTREDRRDERQDRREERREERRDG